jgi:hypothetical protein
MKTKPRLTDEQMDLYGYSDIKERVDIIWAFVFKRSNEVLRQSKMYGFHCMQEVPDPNIHGMLIQLQVFSAVMDILITNGPEAGLEYGQTRLILNAKEQVTRMERVATALKANNKEDYDAAIAELERQAAI